MSYKYFFNGKVLPERTNVNLYGLDWFTFEQPDTNMHFKLKVHIYLSQILVTVDSEIEITDLVTLRNYLFNVISFFVDCIGYENGCGYTIEITSCTYDNGNAATVFGVNIDNLKNTDINSQWGSTTDLIESFRKANTEQQPQLQRAIADFRSGILVSHDTGFYVYRAIESIQVAFNNSWIEMNTALNLNKTYTDYLRENHGRLQRHGKYTFMTSNQRIDMLIRAKTIISRFVFYINNSSQPLNSPKFPELV